MTLLSSACISSDGDSTKVVLILRFSWWACTVTRDPQTPFLAARIGVGRYTPAKINARESTNIEMRFQAADP